MPVFTGQGQFDTGDEIPYGFICGLHNRPVPTGWALCDGTAGTPDLRKHMIVGDAALGLGSSGGTVDADSGLAHSGFAVGNHSNHSPTQPGNHSNHAVTQPSAHSNHTVTQPDNHGTHAAGGAHTHDAHTMSTDGSTAIATNKLVGPPTHSSEGSHDHGAHEDHSSFDVNAHSAHASAALDAHSAHAGFAVDAHSAHSITQPATHAYAVYTLALIMKT